MDADSIFGGYHAGYNGSVMVLPRAPSPPPSRHEVRARKLMTRNPAAYQGGGPAVVPPPMRRARAPPGGSGGYGCDYGGGAPGAADGLGDDRVSDRLSAGPSRIGYGGGHGGGSSGYGWRADLAPLTEEELMSETKLKLSIKANQEEGERIVVAAARGQET